MPAEVVEELDEDVKDVEGGVERVDGFEVCVLSLLLAVVETVSLIEATLVPVSVVVVVREMIEVKEPGGELVETEWGMLEAV